MSFYTFYVCYIYSPKGIYISYNVQCYSSKSSSLSKCAFSFTQSPSTDQKRNKSSIDDQRYSQSITKKDILIHSPVTFRAVGQLRILRKLEKRFLMHLDASASNSSPKMDAEIYQILFCVEFVEYTKIHFTMIFLLVVPF